VEGRVHHFGARGLYNGGLLLGDRETGSYWQHLTGACVHGPLRGRTLEVFPLLHTTAGRALDAFPNAQTALSRLSFRQRALLRAQEGTLRLLGSRLPPGFQLTMGEEDRRLPRMERGLAVWTERAQRFYPTATLRACGDAVLDAGVDLSPAGGRLLVYVDPASGTPAGLRTEATACDWQRDSLVLNTGEWVSGNIVYDAQGVAQPAGRPMQSLACWYSYAFTFPGGDVYTG
jgi:hypothetical protein